MKGARVLGLLVAACVAAAALASSLPGLSAGRSGHHRRHHSAGGGCSSPSVDGPRNPANPLALPNAPSNGDPLQGAQFFVDGPRHGQAAGAVAQLIGTNPKNVSESTSWDAFKAQHQAAINGDGKARAISKIADQEETQNMSLYAQGGGPGAIFSQTQKLLWNNMAA